MRKNSALRGGAQQLRQVVDTAGRKRQAVGGWAQIACVRYRRHFQRRLRAVEEGVEHLRVEVPGSNLLFREAVMAPDGVGGRLVVDRQVLGALAGADDFKADGAGP